MTFTAINLQALPEPNVIEPVEPETFITEIKNELKAKFPPDHPIHAVLELESEPLVKIIEVIAYRYALKISEENRKARSLMLAKATKGDLDHLGVTYYRVQRKLITPADNSAIPPVAAVYETDDAYRERCALSVEAETKAGSAGAYLFHALSAHPDVFSAQVHSPNPTEVDVYLAGQLEGDALNQSGQSVGVSAAAIDAVNSSLTADDVRPLTDLVRVQSAVQKNFRITATVYVQAGLSPQLILEKGLQDLRQYISTNFRPGNRIATSRIIGALDVAGVSRIELTEPASDVTVTVGQIAKCTTTTISAVSGS